MLLSFIIHVPLPWFWWSLIWLFVQIWEDLGGKPLVNIPFKDELKSLLSNLHHIKHCKCIVASILHGTCKFSKLHLLCYIMNGKASLNLVISWWFRHTVKSYPYNHDSSKISLVLTNTLLCDYLWWANQLVKPYLYFCEEVLNFQLKVKYFPADIFILLQVKLKLTPAATVAHYCFDWDHMSSVSHNKDSL